MNRFLYCTFSLLALIGANSYATIRTWPGTSPCDTTLQACIGASVNNDTVQVQTSATINESPHLSKPMRLIAVPGYRPVLSAGNSLSAFYSPGAGVSWSVDIEGFTLLDGYVRATQSSGAATIILRNLDVSTNSNSVVGSAVLVENYGADPLIYEVANNRVRLQYPTDSSLTAIAVQPHTSTPQTGSIHDNRVLSMAGASNGIGVQLKGANSSVRIYSNQVNGNIEYGISASGFQNSSATLVSNAVACTVASTGQGLSLVSFGGTLALQVFNNSTVGCDTGIEINGSSVTGRLTNNLVANSSSLGFYIPPGLAATLSNDHNLSYGNAGNQYTPGASTITTDPMLLRGANDLRLNAGSPAIDAADSAALHILLANTGIPEIDADGLRRFKGPSSIADIGAFENGDIAAVEMITSANVGVINNTALNGISTALPQLVQNQNPDTYFSSYYAGLVGLNYTSAHFGVINESGSLTPQSGTGYNVFVPAPGNGVFMHTSSAANVAGFTTYTDNAYVNSHPERILLVTHRSTPLFNHPFGLVYGFGHWFLQQLDAHSGDPNFASNVNFHIYAQDPSLNAFVWVVPAGPTINYTEIDHLLLNGDSCGRIYVTNSNLNAHPFEVDFYQNHWTITNVDGGAMAAGTQFYVVVDEAATTFCHYDHVFHSGFAPLG